MKKRAATLELCCFGSYTGGLVRKEQKGLEGREEELLSFVIGSYFLLLWASLSNPSKDAPLSVIHLDCFANLY